MLVDQNRCRGWRVCIAACPYKKMYYNWHTGKSEKCILCYPRLETGQAPACFHSCVGRIRYLGVVLYDARVSNEVAALPLDEIIEGQRSLILDPHDPDVIAAARLNGIHDSRRSSRPRKSPTYKFVKGLEDCASAACRVSHYADAVLRAADGARDVADRTARLSRTYRRTCSTTSMRLAYPCSISRTFSARVRKERCATLCGSRRR